MVPDFPAVEVPENVTIEDVTLEDAVVLDIVVVPDVATPDSLRKHRSSNLESIIKCISKEKDAKYESKISDALISYLKNLNTKKKYLLFHETLSNLFGADILDDEEFLRWVAKKLQLRPYRLLDTVSKWQNAGLVERRGRNSINLEIQQKIYDKWFENCIVSTDTRNGRNIVQNSK